ncbi:unnamed protein product [Prorocentrum cordatum]|uniref:Uncharacterized protein n=1 Tax=Prorocentrum cordatum TaxID=2364126 RepID=A0ABN9RL35_9DINO|nr:unnamed protein product [Polarella glacialis]
MLPTCADELIAPPSQTGFCRTLQERGATLLFTVGKRGLQAQLPDSLVGAAAARVDPPAGPAGGAPRGHCPDAGGQGPKKSPLALSESRGRRRATNPFSVPPVLGRLRIRYRGDHTVGLSPWVSESKAIHLFF